jgi:4-hydroxybenzoate polyprenyltransferase
MNPAQASAGNVTSCATPPVRSSLEVVRGLVVSVRPAEWIKNTLAFAAAVFSGNFFVPAAFLHSLLAFVALCLGASATYLINDVKDYEGDRRHPGKRHRPIASGIVAPRLALVVAGLAGAAGISLAFAVNRGTGLTLLAYLALTTLYSLILKHIVILDVVAVASGFVLRVIAGAEAVGVYFSTWLVLCTFLLALFLGFGKRRNELVLLEDDAQSHRPVLGEYSPHFLDMMMAVVTTATVMSYALYTMDPETVARFHTGNVVYTSVFVLYGIFRYLYLIHQKAAGGNPALLLYRDWGLRLALLLWVLSVLLLRYL